jgi:hypothetical protein
VVKTCECGCGTEFEVKASEFHRRRYCSKAHMDEARKQRSHKKCDWDECDKVLELIPSQVRNKNFCCSNHRALYFGRLLTNKVQKICLWCGEPFTTIPARADTSNFCSQRCRALYYSTHKHGIMQEYPEKPTIAWSEGIAWFVGLVTSDGNLSKFAKAITVTSSDVDVLEQVQDVVLHEITGRRNAVVPSGRGHCYRFTSDVFYAFCSNVGLTPNKSLTLTALNVPGEYFRHFLRGVIDGDGSIRVYTKKGCHFRHLQIRVISASHEFLKWLRTSCREHLGVRGGGFCKVNVNQWTDDKQYWEVVFSHYDSLRIAQAIYRNANYYLDRKRNTAEEFQPFDVDSEPLKHQYTSEEDTFILAEYQRGTAISTIADHMSLTRSQVTKRLRRHLSNRSVIPQ